MLIKKSFLVLFFLAGFNCLLLKAQTGSDCEQTLNQAAEEFSAGHFYGLPALLKPCLDKLTKEQSIRAYTLLTQAYLVIDDPIAAEDSYLKLLRANPEYIATPDKDPIDIVYISKKFTTRPIFTPRLVFGANVSLARIIQQVNTDPMSVDTKQRMGLGYQLGGGLDWNVDDHWSVCFDALYGAKSFESSKTGISIRDNQKITESQTWFDIPVYAKYSREFGRLRPYGYAGLGINLLLNSSATANFTNNSESGNQAPVDGTIPLLYKRNTFNRSIVLGIGMRYKINKNFITIDLRYMGGFSNLAKINATYYDDGTSNVANSITQYRWIGDLFRLDNLSISVGYGIPLYKPRKIDFEKKQGGILKGLFKKKEKVIQQ